MKLSDVRKGKKIGGGSFGDVFEGTYKGQPVILKERKENKGAQGLRFFQTEAAIGRRLKGAAGAADFIGVAGANAYLVYKDEGRVTLESILGKRDGLKNAVGAKDEAEAVADQSQINIDNTRTELSRLRSWCDTHRRTDCASYERFLFPPSLY